QSGSENLRLAHGHRLVSRPVQDEKRRIVFVEVSEHGKSPIELGRLSARLSQSRNVLGITEIDRSIKINDTVHRAQLLCIRAGWIEAILRLCDADHRREMPAGRAANYADVRRVQVKPLGISPHPPHSRFAVI